MHKNKYLGANLSTWSFSKITIAVYMVMLMIPKFEYFSQYYIAPGKKYPILKQDINQEKVAGIFIRVTPLLPGQGYFDIAVLRI